MKKRQFKLKRQKKGEEEKRPTLREKAKAYKNNVNQQFEFQKQYFSGERTTPEEEELREKMVEQQQRVFLIVIGALLLVMGVSWLLTLL